MRIIAGRWKGRRLARPKGAARPTADRVREALFSSILSTMGPELDGAEVLDLFAGTGALALEALSRGAARATIVDSDPRAVSVVRRNVGDLGADGVEICRGDAFEMARGGAIPGGPFSLLFLDPPYRIEPSQVRSLLEDLAAGGALLPGALVAYEHDRRTDPSWPEGFEADPVREYGDTVLSLAEYRGGT